MACGCPVIASRIPSTQEVAGDIPIYFEPDNPESLKAALDFLISNSDLDKQISKGIEKASQYSWEKTAKSFHNELRKLNV
jgi:glycosyltransferase involved in cell wall biosynthesis